jgi:putative ABC transport system ATP-binding protein
MALIRTENLTKIYGSGEASVTALSHVSMEIDAGQFVAVMGPSGCGKSTLLHLLGGLDRPTEGKISIDGACLSEMKTTSLPGFAEGGSAWYSSSTTLSPC